MKNAIMFLALALPHSVLAGDALVVMMPVRGPENACTKAAQAKIDALGEDPEFLSLSKQYARQKGGDEVRLEVEIDRGFLAWEFRESATLSVNGIVSRINPRYANDPGNPYSYMNVPAKLGQVDLGSAYGKAADLLKDGKCGPDRNAVINALKAKVGITAPPPAGPFKGLRGVRLTFSKSLELWAGGAPPSAAGSVNGKECRITAYGTDFGDVTSEHGLIPAKMVAASDGSPQDNDELLSLHYPQKIMSEEGDQNGNLRCAAGMTRSEVKTALQSIGVVVEFQEQASENQTSNEERDGLISTAQ